MAVKNKLQWDVRIPIVIVATEFLLVKRCREKLTKRVISINSATCNERSVLREGRSMDASKLQSTVLRKRRKQKNFANLAKLTNSSVVHGGNLLRWQVEEAVLLRIQMTLEKTRLRVPDSF
jgi:hypothetical protein